MAAPLTSNEQIDGLEETIAALSEELEQCWHPDLQASIRAALDNARSELAALEKGAD